MQRWSRRRVLIGSAALAAVVAAAPGVAVATPPPVSPIQADVAGLERANNLSIGVYAVDLGSGQTVVHRPTESYAMLSTFKAYAAARVLQMAERGELSLQDRMFVDPAAMLPNSPITGERDGGDMTLAELCQAVLQQSDNAAANILLHRIGGPPAITGFARSIGDDRSRLDRWEIELNSAIPGDPRDTSTPLALGEGFRTLLAGDALAPAQRQQLDEWMRANRTSSMRAGFPPGWTSADKTGSGDYGSTNDVGIAYGPAGERLLISVMMRSAGTDPKAPNLRPVIGQVAELVISTLTS